MNNNTTSTFTRYQIFIIAILAILQFTLILDFMVLSPLGAILMKELSLQPNQFGLVVSAYAFSAGASGLLAAGFADRFDRKKLLLFFYVGFIFGTTLCAVADSYEFLLIARIVTGIFGGVIGSISFAIISDLFKLEMRGRVMGFVQMAFSASQILGLPIGLYLANAFGWHSPFWMIVGFSIIVGIAIVAYMQPITEHLKVQNDRNPFEHLWKTLSKPDYLRAFLATILLATGGFMLMPFGSAFSINNLKIDIKDLPMLYLVTGIFTITFGPLSGKLSDKLGKYKVFFVGSIITSVMVLIYTNLGQTPLWLVVIVNVLMFAGITARMISASSLMTAVPQMQDRGAFMSINSSIQQISGGAAAALAGVIVSEGSDGTMQNYPFLGIVVVASMIITIGMMYVLNRQIQKKQLNKF
ncbi:MULTISPECIES: MFS transporter [Emticicia]|uniref:MFS transporter n=1 Tax=Emticicia TaxID=312278 RepID=UPI0007D8AAB9|nr:MULTISPECIES: MFS transporter [Emticicia]